MMVFRLSHFDEQPQLESWRTNSEKMDAVLKAIVEQTDYITQNEINSLQRWNGKTGHKFVEKLKNKMASNRLQQLETNERQKIENMDIDKDIIKRICNNISEKVGQTLSQVIDDTLKQVVDALDTNWVEDYDNATNHFMNALQVYYHKKTAAHKV